MAFNILHDYVVVDAESGRPIARTRGSDKAGWMAMSTAENGWNNALMNGALFPTARAALGHRVLPNFHQELDAALKRASRKG